MANMWQRMLAVIVVVCLLTGPTGCTSKTEEATTNPELKVPEIPPVSSKDGGKKSPEKK